MRVDVIERYNNLFNRISKATPDDMSTLFEDVKDFYTECNSLNGINIKRIVDIYMEKFQEMMSDNEAAYEKTFAKLNEEKNVQYDFSGEIDDTGAVQTMMLQLMGSLPKVNNKANAYVITTAIDKALNSGTVGCKAVLALAQYSAYEDMVGQRQRVVAVDGSKSANQKAFEHTTSAMQEKYKNECVELYQQGFRLRTLNKRVDTFMRSVRNEEIKAADEARPSFWGNAI